MKELGNAFLSLLEIENIIALGEEICLSQAATRKIHDSYQAIQVLAKAERPYYGINTGFGALAEVKIEPVDQAKLQRNIILSHAVGVGEPLDFAIAKTLMLLRLNTLAQGYSGASPLLIHQLIGLFNANCAPFVPQKGSVGASGDLAPLAHLGLLLLGLGQAYIDGRQSSASDALHHAKLAPLTLGVRDGLALINGTQAMAASAAMALTQCHNLALIADVSAASSLDALAGHDAPFDERIHLLKPHPGQLLTAKNIRAIRRDRKPENCPINKLTQDPYSLRCIPQVHGASKDVISHVSQTVEIEINSVTDNPLLFFDEEQNLESLSGGNFHGQHIALALDYLAMGVAELANIAERRIELMLNPRLSNGLPPFLIENSGINSGYMMLHVTAAALVNENKVLCHPASIDSIPTSASREDHVSMGMTAANKLWQVITNTKTVLAIELLASHQALDMRPKESISTGIKKIHRSLRELVAFREEDGLFPEELDRVLSWLNSKKCLSLMNEIVSA